MSGGQLPLWHEGWEAEADSKARRPPPRRRWARRVPTDHGRSTARPQIPNRPVVNVIRSL